MEATGVYWLAPWRALAAAGIDTQLLNARDVKQPSGRRRTLWSNPNGRNRPR